MPARERAVSPPKPVQPADSPAAGTCAGRNGATPSLASKVAFLCRRGSYPERPATVEVIETRLSWVFLTPNEVWKLKKPLRYDHLDFSRADARRHDCLEEVRLNAPLAPGVYRGVVPLTSDAEGWLALDGEGTPVDHLVRMRRLPRDACLEQCIGEARADRADVERAAQRLAAFYLEAADADRVDPARMAAVIEDEARALRELPLPRPREGERLRDGLLRWLRQHEGQLRERRQIEAHGDLRPQHIYLTRPPVFIDRLTFRRDLRLMDPFEELGFLALDCERLGAPWIGECFLRTYAEASGDRPDTPLVAFYRARRGLLWAVLSGRHLIGGNTDRPWERIAVRYRTLALRWLAAA